MQEGPTLQTFYSCTDCVFYRPSIKLNVFEPLCLKTNKLLQESCCNEYIKTPIDCPLLGKSQEYDVRFDRDILIRNL